LGYAGPMTCTFRVLGPAVGQAQEIVSGHGTMAKALFLSGHFMGRPLCSGIGRCGQCRVTYLSSAPEANSIEQEVLTPQELRSGIRLACRREARNGDVVVIEPSDRDLAVSSGKIRGTGLGLAVDLGTTTLKWSILGTQDGPISGQEPNPQMGSGSEVISRLAFAMENPSQAEFLRLAVVRRLERLAGRTGCMGRMAVAGNSVMVHLLLGAPLEGLSRAPYSLAVSGGSTVHLSDALPEAYIPPLLGPFLGADISAGLCAILGEDVHYPFLFCDLGTNGEMVLGLAPDRFLAASVALGPALEGVGLSMGSVAEAGVVLWFSTGADGPIPYPMPGGAWKRISGTGYLSLLASLRRLGAVEEEGRFAAGRTPLARRIMEGLDRSAGRLALPGGLFLSASDVEEILKVKAAFNAGTAALLRGAGIPFNRLGAVYLAGTFGEHVAEADLTTLGFLPEQTRGKLIRAGNTSLKGAVLLMDSPEARERAESLRNQVHIVGLVEDEGFQRRFLQSMRFVHVDE
jgi:uncharacterized 2Fe-2S/4Fe-4S cluster protein (DUF4445 family)